MKTLKPPETPVRDQKPLEGAETNISQPQEPVQTQPPQPVEPAPQPPPAAPQKSNKILVITIILLILSALGAGGYWAYQNYFIQKPSPTPTPSPSPTPDETAGWKTYTNDKYGFSLKYPPELSHKAMEFSSESGIGDHFSLGSNIEIIVRDPNLTEEEVIRNYSNYEIKNVDGTKVIRTEATSSSIGGGPPYLKQIGYYYFLPKYTFIVFYEESQEGNFTKNQSTFDQILSTFNFLEEGKVCTQEAKLCPDGSYVGRTGPNCEFTPCPSP